MLCCSCGLRGYSPEPNDFVMLGFRGVGPAVPSFLSLSRSLATPQRGSAAPAGSQPIWSGPRRPTSYLVGLVGLADLVPDPASSARPTSDLRPGTYAHHLRSYTNTHGASAGLGGGGGQRGKLRYGPARPGRRCASAAGRAGRPGSARLPQRARGVQRAWPGRASPVEWAPPKGHGGGARGSEPPPRRKVGPLFGAQVC